MYIKLVNYKKGGTRLIAASNKVYQLLAHGRWFSPGTPASSTTRTGRHDIAAILLKVALNTINQIKSMISNRSWFTEEMRHVPVPVIVLLTVDVRNISKYGYVS